MSLSKLVMVSEFSFYFILFLAEIRQGRPCWALPAMKIQAWRTCYSLHPSLHIFWPLGIALLSCSSITSWLLAFDWSDLKKVLKHFLFKSLLLECSYKIFLAKCTSRLWEVTFYIANVCSHLFLMPFPDDQGHRRKSGQEPISLHAPYICTWLIKEERKLERKQLSILFKATWLNSISVSVQQKKCYLYSGNDWIFADWHGCQTDC